jgi:tetratricopeptide (TPR) repeat protein
MAFNDRGVARAAKGDRTAAIADYTEAIRLDPHSALAYTNRALTHSISAPADALPDLDQAIRLDPLNASAYSHRARVRGTLGDEAGADADRAAWKRLDPKGYAREEERRVLEAVRMNFRS